jgi:hypothetical protein
MMPENSWPVVKWDGVSGGVAAVPEALSTKIGSLLTHHARHAFSSQDMRLSRYVLRSRCVLMQI